MTSLTELLSGLHGTYRGTNTLYDPNAGGAPVASPSTLAVVPYAGGRFHGLHYTWSYPANEVDQDGLLLVGENDGGAYATWIDSWHNGRNAMTLAQDPDHEGAVPLLRGTFPAPPDPDWGWTILIEGEGGSIRMFMEVVTPGGDAAPAVEGMYRREG